jgi:hypothetical protein
MTTSNIFFGGTPSLILGNFQIGSIFMIFPGTVLTMRLFFRTALSTLNECHAAIRAGGAKMDLGGAGITDQDVEWIAGALANPAVR